VTKTISVSIPHRLTQQEARTRLQNGIADLKTKHAGKITNLEETWTGNQLAFKLAAMGQKISGRVDVQSDAVKLNVDLPWLIAALANKFRPQIETEGRRMLK
jgi:hypothetical protein